MLTEINSITKQFFQKENLDDTLVEELKEFIEKYPYSASARFLLAKKLPDNRENLLTAGLYISNPLRLDWLLRNNEEKEILAVPETKPEQTLTEEPLAFQSYHTIDYFASQGIRLQMADLGKDKLGQQLKSFTEWLRSMKKLPTSQTISPQMEDVHVTRNAASSIEEKEVLTEAMAEVWIKQGNREKAREIYGKLSLQNPDKSAYFAAKTDQLK
jgi:hypothetical protein